MSRLVAAWAGVCLSVGTVAAETVPFDDRRWSIEAKESRIEDYKGKRALYLKDGQATLTDGRLEDGVIEFDLCVPEDSGFSGLSFRREDDTNYEEFYVRHHLSGKPDANQYTPVFHGVSGWQIYTGPRYGAPVRHPIDQWMHVRLAVSGSRAEVSIDGDTPVLAIPELKSKPAAGGLALYSRLSPARFANFSYRPGPTTLVSAAAPPETRPPGVVTTWDVSSPLDEKSLESGAELPSSLTAGLRWSPLEVEGNGIANLARLHGNAKGRETVLARLRLVSLREQVKKIRFGFSDRVKVYVNGRLLYAGEDGFLSRDYRFLGTVGLFDTIAAPLRQGDNDVVFAVSETFGGWAVIAQIPDREGLR